MFEMERISRSDITGLGVRGGADWVFEVERILQPDPNFWLGESNRVESLQ